MPEKDPPPPDLDEQTVQNLRLRHLEGFALLVSSAAGTTIVPLLDRTSFVIGRSPGCDIVVVDESVSRKHARLRVDTLSIEDLFSTNGTRVQGRPVAPGKSASLGIGAAFELGSATLVLQ